MDPIQSDPLTCLADALTKARRKRDAELWRFQSAAAVFADKPYERHYGDVIACADRLREATVQVDAAQEAIDDLVDDPDLRVALKKARGEE